jgi:hypothetical protein
MNFEDFIIDKNIEMKSNELNELLNTWRTEEGKKSKEHKEFMRDIRKEMKLLESLGFEVGGKFPPTTYIDKQGKERGCYLLNKEGILQMSTKESAYVRAKVIDYIRTLETYIEESGQSEEFKYYRRTGKIIRRGLTDAIKKVYGNTDKFIYAKYTNLVYTIVFDKSASEIRLGKGLKKNQALRDNFTSEELDEILEVENKLKSLIEVYEMEGVCLDLIYERAKNTILRVYHKIAI